MEELTDYIIKHSQKEPDILRELSRETCQKVLNPQMLSGVFQGRFLSVISKIIQPRKILEIGTYTGYSALCLCEGLHPKGRLYTIDKNEELVSFQQKYFRKSKYKGQIEQLLGDALEIIPKIEEKFDLVFIDADKRNYSNYFHLIIDKMNSGGVVMSDNVLWKGKVLEKLNPADQDTKAIVKYNKLISRDKRLETVLLPIRDGLTISRVK